MKTTWTKNIDIPLRPEFHDKAACDVIVVGGGLAGSLSAYLLAKAGKRVIVVDKGKMLDHSTTPYTTAFLSSDPDTALSDLKKMFGEENGNDVWRSHADAIDMIESIIREENIECEFMRIPEFWYSTSEKGFKQLQEEAEEARAAEFSFAEIMPEKMSFKNYGVVELKNQAKFHPIKFLLAIQEKAIEYGALFYESSEVEEIEGDTPVVVRIKGGGTITGEFVIVATYLSIENPPSIFAKKGKYVSYVYELSIPNASLSEGVYLDDNNPYHYFRIDAGRGENGRDRMVYGGEDHRKELPVDPKKQFSALLDHLHQFFPDISYEIVNSWTGIVLETFDGLPYIGRPSDDERPHLLVATGFSGNGMTYSMTSAAILSDIILGKKNRYEDVFSPYRQFSWKGVVYKTRDYLGEFADGYLRTQLKKS